MAFLRGKKIKKLFTKKNLGFWAIFGIAFLGSLYLFSSIGLAPHGVETYINAIGPTNNETQLNNGNDTAKQNPQSYKEGEKQFPVKIVIEKIDVEAPVINPNSTSKEFLNNKLKEGVIRYPDSGFLGDKRNMLLMGHASTLPAVNNEMYKVFSKMRELDLGDTFKIYSEDRVYFYKVMDMSLTNTDEAKIDFDTGRREVTLSTCNTLGEKNERFVVRAEFVESFPLD